MVLKFSLDALKIIVHYRHRRWYNFQKNSIFFKKNMSVKKSILTRSFDHHNHGKYLIGNVVLLEH